MKTEFNNRFNQLEAKRKELFEELKSHSDDVINTKPNPKAWSIAEVMLHLMAADEASLIYLQKKILGVTVVGKSGVKGSLKLLILKIAFIIPIKFKAPKVTTPSSKHITLKEINKKWDSIKNDTLELVNKLNGEDFEKELWRHPISGKMNLLQMIDFTVLHFDRHKQQIAKTLKSITG